MKVRILNGPLGVQKSVLWKDGKTAPLERKTVRNVDFCLGDLDEAGQFQPKQAVQRLQFSEDVTEREVVDAVQVRAKELEAMIPTVATVIDLEVPV